MKSVKEHFDKMGIYYMLPASMLFLFILYKSVVGSSKDKIEQEGQFFPYGAISSRPSVLANNNSDLVTGRLKHEAVLQFAKHRLPENLEQWEIHRSDLKNKIIQNTGLITPRDLPLDIKETGFLGMEGYTIRKITFQTLPGIHATANLFVPDGEGPFPAVIHMLGHWNEGKIAPFPQSVGHSLALNGYVVLTIDPWGAGERSTNHGQYEYHGANLGASILNLGESLMGIHIAENKRGIDLLESLAYVDPDKIGATGASGGGNQTMWLAAMDERVKAAVPVVSVGTFESYIMGSNCICETMVDGLSFTEEAGILAMVAPRALAIYNGEKEANAAFLPSEMLRSYRNAKPIFKLYGVENNLKNQVFDLDHGYHPEMREAMIGWFDLHLKGVGTGEPVKEPGFDLVPPEKLMVFADGKRDAHILTTEAYCKLRGNELRKHFLDKTTFNAKTKKEELHIISRINNNATLKAVHSFSKADGWDLFALETSQEKLIPVLHRSPSHPFRKYVV
jgi:hypothetical protein